MTIHSSPRKGPDHFSHSAKLQYVARLEDWLLSRGFVLDGVEHYGPDRDDVLYYYPASVLEPTDDDFVLIRRRWGADAGWYYTYTAHCNDAALAVEMALVFSEE